jgi:hypothetical protein
MRILKAEVEDGSHEFQSGEPGYRHDEPCIITIPPPQPKRKRASPPFLTGLLGWRAG